MRPCKRIEIIIESVLADRVIECLHAENVSGYTLIHGVSGQGGRGQRLDDDPAGTASNCLFVVACDSAAEAEAVVTAVRPLLTRSGGVCLVSDAAYVKH
ncbi:MAG: hypothetical protein KDI36_17190 [Pseudomonadales bacterium]|nr:hypothetical protein [Pseudomonadales bacterium]